MEIFVPDIYQKSIYDINYKKLKKRGIKCLLFKSEANSKNEEIKNRLKFAHSGTLL